ncbi:MAG: ABC transporter ATP-binding protein [Spirochaetales bacterium]|jgi:ABC-2 type transport system ATP-binding protein|nr:ABC transporter ATP-binding protein [Exilispira sp.]NMC67652.1 ABC transporter ATP-binding protein [Spirochaetales bacterium]
MAILALKVDNLSIRSGKKDLVSMLSFSIEKQSIYGIFAPTGSGKTDILKAIIGLKKVKNGEINLLDKKMPDFSILRFVGYIPKQRKIFPLLTIEENLYFFGRNYGMTKGQIEWKSEELLSITNLKNLKKTKIKDLSFDQQVMASFICSLVHCPSFLILDDPLSGMSLPLSQFIIQQIYYQKEQGNTVLFTSSNINDANICDKILILSRGKELIEEKPSAILRLTNSKTLDEAILRLQ